MDDKKIKEEIAQYWNTRGGVYDTQPGHGLKSAEEKTEWLKFLKSVVPADAKKILDVGGGTGFLTLLLAELGYNVKSVDLSEGMQNDAKRKAIEGNLTDRIEFAIADAEKTGEPDNSFDVVVNRHLLWTLPHPSEAVDEWLRVVKPGGKVIYFDGDYRFAYNNKRPVWKWFSKTIQKFMDRDHPVREENTKEEDNVFLQLKLIRKERPKEDRDMLVKTGFSKIRIIPDKFRNSPVSKDFWTYGYQGKKFIAIVWK